MNCSQRVLPQFVKQNGKSNWITTNSSLLWLIFICKFKRNVPISTSFNVLLLYFKIWQTIKYVIFFILTNLELHANFCAVYYFSFSFILSRVAVSNFSEELCKMNTWPINEQTECNTIYYLCTSANNPLSCNQFRCHGN